MAISEIPQFSKRSSRFLLGFYLEFADRDEINLATLTRAMAKLRNSHGVCPPEVLKFILDLFKYNDNTKNTFSDNYYRAALV